MWRAAPDKSTGDGTVTPLGGAHERWSVHLIDTGHETNTGGRLRRLAPWLLGETFMLVDSADYQWPESPCRDFGTRKDNSYKQVPPK